MRNIPTKMRDYILDCAKKAAYNIGVSHFEIDVLYMKNPKDVDWENGDKEDTVAATMTTDRRYLKCTLKIYPVLEDYWSKGNKQMVKQAIHHEVAHVATQHLMDCATARYCEVGEMKDAWETLTEVVSRMSIKIDKLEK